MGRSAMNRLAGPLLGVVAVVAAVLVRRRRRRFAPPGRGGPWPETGGVREPRRPLVPAASGTAEVDLPE